jgi:hypothetical protein
MTRQNNNNNNNIAIQIPKEIELLIEEYKKNND